MSSQRLHRRRLHQQMFGALWTRSKTNSD